MIIKRKIQSLVEGSLFHGKVVIIYGARQVGKTTLVKEILKNYSESSSYLNCDEPDIRQALANKTSTELKSFLGSKKLIILDEAQRVKDIGLTLKLMVDNFIGTQIIATGSSSFELSNHIIEPLTGRKKEFFLYPLSLQELSQINDELEMNRLLERRLVYGMYPSIALADGGEAETDLKELARSYLYKDILNFENIRNNEAVEKLLQALALQIGKEVSYSELSSLVGIDKKTVASYLDILEKAFIVFRLNPFSRNLRNELKKLRKVYFYDTGVRNILINNLNPLGLRQDVGQLWENFILSERLKCNYNNGREQNSYFWRTREGQEIDLIEEKGGRLSAFEFKWQSDKLKTPKSFLDAYPGSSLRLINNNNYREFVME
ncbi:ATP-binding protein [Candidatus Kuenenbacteria bacterium]|nr:ATP-binding protein [Candidatus Kuenenbacteria bacterium]